MDGKPRDVVILGAGLAGSSVAAALARRGWDVLLVDQRRLPAHKVCGEFLSPEAQLSLTALGLRDTVAALAPSPIHTARLVSAHGVTVDTPLPGEAWGVSRYALDAALASAAGAAGADVRLGVTAVGLDRDGAQHVVHIRGASGMEAIATRAVIVACGRHPSAGLRAAPASPDPRRLAVGVKLHVEGLIRRPCVELYFFQGGYVGVGPVEGGRANVCLLSSRAAFTRSGGRVPDMLAAIGRWNPAFGRRLAGARAIPGTTVTVAAVDTRVPATPWHGVARLGDAAVMIPPLCGDGMAMALRSAELTAPLAHAHLAGSLSLAAWEAAWRETWHTEFDGPLCLGRRLERLLSVPQAAEALLLMGRLAPGLAARLVRGTRGQAQAVATTPGPSPEQAGAG